MFSRISTVSANGQMLSHASTGSARTVRQPHLNRLSANGSDVQPHLNRLSANGSGVQPRFDRLSANGQVFSHASTGSARTVRFSRISTGSARTVRCSATSQQAQRERSGVQPHLNRLSANGQVFSHASTGSARTGQMFSHISIGSACHISIGFRCSATLRQAQCERKDILPHHRVNRM